MDALAEIAHIKVIPRKEICTLDLRTENPVARRFIDFMNRKVEQ